MKVLIVVPTYDRVEYLGRVLASFQSQTYEDVELLIINDQKNLTLKCHDENVHIININKQILLPQKRNIGANFGYYDVISTLDDDCLMMPKYLERHIEILKEKKHIKLVKDDNILTIMNNTFDVGGALGNWSHTRDVWFDVHGYELDRNKGEDQEFLNKIPKKHREFYDNEEYNFIYGWTGINYHCSVGNDHEYRDGGEERYKKPTEITIMPDFESYNNAVLAVDCFTKNKPFTIKDVNGKITVETDNPLN